MHGLRVATKGADRTTAAIKWLIENLDGRREMEEQAGMAAARFDWLKIADRHIDVYEHAMNR